MKLWGKSAEQLQAARMKMIAWREELARRDAAARDRLTADMTRDAPRARSMTAAELGQHYRQAMQSQGDEDVRQRIAAEWLARPVRREYHFGTDIPAPTWQEVEAERARRGSDDAGHAGKWIVVAALFALPVLFALALLYLILT